MTEWAEVSQEHGYDVDTPFPPNYCEVVLHGERSDGYVANFLCRNPRGHEGAHDFGTPAQQEAMLQYPRE